MNENEIKRMEQEAVRHAQDMQNRAKKQNSNENNSKKNQSEPKKEDSETKSPFNSDEAKKPDGGIFDILMKDKERTLILCLILLLMDEKADNSLILALFYLLI